jgi:hypothetical protein
MKQYQHWLAQYLTCHRDNGHVMAAELAESICAFWQARLSQGRRGISFMPIRWSRSITELPVIWHLLIFNFYQRRFFS